MKNRISTIICFIFFVCAGYSQNTQLTIEGTNGKFYLDHTVFAKENWYSIGRLFNLPPHDIAGFNNMSFDKPLDIGQQIHIPLTASNFDQKPVKTAGESLIPVFHMVQEKEWIFKISSIYNDVPVTSLEKWNKIKKDDVKQGLPLIIGFLKVKTDLSPLAVGISSNPAGSETAKINKPDETPVQTASKPSTSNSTPLYRPEPAKTPATTVTNTSSATTIVPVSNANEKVNNYATTHSNGGFFSTDYAGS